MKSLFCLLSLLGSVNAFADNKIRGEFEFTGGRSGLAATLVVNEDGTGVFSERYFLTDHPCTGVSKVWIEYLSDEKIMFNKSTITWFGSRSRNSGCGGGNYEKHEVFNYSFNADGSELTLTVPDVVVLKFKKR